MRKMPGLESYFPKDRGEPCYAVYATAIDRFLVVDSHDLSILVRAATLFSSKMVTVVCVYDNKTNPRLTDETCIAWAPVHRLSQANRRNTTVLLLEGPDAIVEKGPPAATVSADMVARAQRYLMFAVRATYAQFMTNAKMGISDTRVIRAMIPELETLPDAPPSAVQQVFLAQLRNQRIEEILYESDSVEQATAELEALLSGEAGRPSAYAVAFNQLLGGHPAYPA